MIKYQDKFNSRLMNNSTVPGQIYGNVSNASTFYAADKLNTPNGHGFFAERVNHLHDKTSNLDFFGGNNVQLIGDNNAKNGADRIVNGLQIQSKYCASGYDCISSCFDNHSFRYYNTDGTPMQIEVPSDMYEDALSYMRTRIMNGEVNGVTDPNEASNIVRQGHYTYEQVRKIAEAGTIDSIIYDSFNGAITGAYGFGISFVVQFATDLWRGENLDVALKNSVYTGLSVGGTTFVSAVIAGQVMRTGINRALIPASQQIINIVGHKGAAVISNGLRSGTNIYGSAAMKNAAKILRNNILTGAITTGVLSIGDVVNMFRGRISGVQCFRNIANTTATMAGGSAGWIGGAAAGAALGSFIPGVGTAIFGLAGGLLGALGCGSVAGKVSQTVLDCFCEDDAKQMVEIIENELVKVCQSNDYLLNQYEVDQIISNLQKTLSSRVIMDMYASYNRFAFARDLVEQEVKKVVENRIYVSMPDQWQVNQSLRNVMDEMFDFAESQGYSYI